MQTLDMDVTLSARNILLIEDNYDDAELLSHQLESLQDAGLSIEHCDCLAAGLRRLDNGGIDLIILDLSLPDSQGTSGVAMIRKSAPLIPLVVLTGTADDATAIKALASGAQDYLLKGHIDLSALCRSMSYAIARQQASEAHERLAAIVESSDDAIIGKTLNGTITSWNKGAEQIFGYSADEATGKSISMLFPPEAGDELSIILAAVAKGETIRNQESVRVKKNGQKVDVSATISPIRMVGGITGAAAIDRDISNRKSAERTLKDTEQRLSLALRAAEVGVWDLDLSTGRVWRSLRHDEIFGYQLLLPQWNFDIFITYVLPEDVSYAKKVFAEGLETGNFKLECRIIRADGAVRWISAQGVTVRNEHGQPIRMMGGVVDITDRKEQEEQHRLMAVLKEREDFMATLTHDMKNPLIGANRLLDLFISGRLGDFTGEQRELLQCMMESNAGVLSLISNLIDVYRMDKEANSLLLEVCDLSRLVSASVSRVAPFTNLRGIAVTTQLPEYPPFMAADSHALQRVLQNLLDNAIKFTPEKGKIHVRLLNVGDYAIIEIEDNGPGVSPDEQNHLFKRFSQGQVGRRSSGGSGLGLYLCKQIVEAHGGTIELTSQPNVATIFRLRLPLRSPKGQGNESGVKDQ